MKHCLWLLSVLLVVSMVAGCTTPATPSAAAPTDGPKPQPTQVQPTNPPAPTVVPTAVPTEAPKASRPLVILASDSPSSPDPAENWAFGGAAYLPHVYDSLFRYVGEASPKLTTLLAAEIPTVENGGISKDGLVYTIKLKPNAKFHDGSPINADAVIYSYERIKALALGANGITADWIDKIEKADNLTVKFTLKQPFADFLNSMGSVWGNYIVNPTICKANEKDKDWCHDYLLSNEAGSGPYKMTSFDKANNQVTLERFADYWGGWDNPNPVEKVIIRWLAEPTGARPLLEKGDADIAINLPTNDYQALQKAAGFVSKKNPSIMQYYLAMNGSVKPLDNPLVRQALQYTVDTSKIISDIFGGNLFSMDAAVGPGYPDVYPAQTQYNFDLTKAKELLTKAGYEKGFDLTVNIIGAMPNDSSVVEFWQADLAKVGINLKIQQVDGGTFGQAWFTDCTAGTAPNIGEVSALGVGGDYPSAWEVIAQVFPTPRLGGAKCSAVYLNDPHVNDAFNQIAKTTDPAQRQTLFKGLYNTLAEDAGAIWLGQGADLVTMRDTVQGYQYYFSMGGNYIPLPKISLKQ